MQQFIKPAGGGAMMAARPEDKQGELVTRFDGELFGDGAQVVVGEREGALFMSNGAVAGLLGHGRHTLTVQNVPFLQNVQDPSGGFRMTLLFVSRIVRGVQFGGRLGPMVDRQGSEGRFTIFGSCALVPTDPGRLVTQLTGVQGDSGAATRWVARELLRHFDGCLSEWVRGGYYTVQNISSALRQLEQVVPQHCGYFDEYGLKLRGFEKIQINDG